MFEIFFNRHFHLKRFNTYEYRYGPDWRIEAKKSIFLRCHTCVSSMIEHMASETKRVFKGTTHKHYFLFYHDALPLMIVNKTCRWTKEKGYEEMRILPEIDLFASNPALKRYRGRPPGNSP